MVQSPKLRSITQGSIFNFARSDGYSANVLGMVISARCDLAQLKQEKFIYVPVVKAKDWIEMTLIPKLTDELRKSLLSDMRNILKANNFSETALDTFGVDTAAQLLKGKSDEVKFLEKSDKLSVVEQYLSLGRFDKSILNPKLLSARIDDVVNNKSEGYFFIDEIIDYQGGNISLGSHIVILGEPRPIHQKAAQGIADGLDHEQISISDRSYDSIIKSIGEMSYVLCNVKSPYIELVLQRFSSFYSRIGVDDPSKTIKDLLAKEVLQ
ncbi:hypothetical protein [Pseudomonas capsici]|uniref:hypothetical protein n=1 Tax=Pseudomonas capsici TaxID=2810614 RepID=UPI00403B20EF